MYVHSKRAVDFDTSKLWVSSEHLCALMEHTCTEMCSQCSSSGAASDSQLCGSKPITLEGKWAEH